MAVNDPTQAPAGPDFSWLTSMAQQAVQQALVQGQQAINNQASALDQRLTALEQQAATQASTSIAAVAPQAGNVVLTAVQKMAATAEHDPWLPRIVVGIFGIAGLIILAGYVAGSHQAQDIWAWIFASFGPVLLVTIRMLVQAMTGNTTAPPKAPGA